VHTATLYGELFYAAGYEIFQEKQENQGRERAVHATRRESTNINGTEQQQLLNIEKCLSSGKQDPLNAVENFVA